MKTKPFALELARALSLTEYPLCNKVQGIVKCSPPIS